MRVERFKPFHDRMFAVAASRKPPVQAEAMLRYINVEMMEACLEGGWPLTVEARERAERTIANLRKQGTVPDS